MLNKEKYRDEIFKIALKHGIVAKIGKKLCTCDDVYDCEQCDFDNMGEDECDCAFENWANSEYMELEIDWTKVPADTPVLVGNDKNDLWIRRYFCKYCNLANDYKFEVFSEGRTSWSSKGDSCCYPYCKLAREEDIEKYRKV